MCIWLPTFNHLAYFELPTKKLSLASVQYKYMFYIFLSFNLKLLVDERVNLLQVIF